tara:strand:- start:47 stop:1000 length:954 start_codon:yes stop_codon:yes gene_type:complete
MSVNPSFFSGTAVGGGPTTTGRYEEPYAQAMRRGFLESAFGLAKTPTPVPVRQVAGLDPFEMQARTLAGGLGGFTPYIQQGGQMMQQAGGYLTPGGIRQFYNPYEQDVVQQTLSDLQEQSAKQGIADRTQAVSRGAFGGSRGRLMEQERERAFGRGAAEALGGIRSTGFGQATTAAQNAARGLGALGTSFADLGTTAQNNLLNQIRTFEGLGGTGRRIQDQMYGAQFDAANRLALEPRQRLSGLQSALGLLPRTYATTTFNPIANTYDPMRGIMDLLGGGNINLPGVDQTPVSTQPAGQSNSLAGLASLLQLFGGLG